MRSYWGLSLVISLAFHAAVIAGAPSFFKDKSIPTKKQETKEIEIIPKKIEKIKEITAEDRLELNSPKPLPYIDNIVAKLIDNKDLSPVEKPKIFESHSREVVFSEVPSEKEMEKNPAYMDYYRLIREKIRANTYHNYNTNRKGEVLVGFLVDKDGSLRNVKLDPESISNEDLRDIALESIKESAPFPAFPPELEKYSQLRFSISIYFKNN
jgi:TonB family protein